jgi:FAD/FMN-containing dehydrogenase
MYALESFIEAIGDVPHTTDPATVRKKSRDYFSISPLLRSALGGLVADIVVSPRTREDVERVVRAAVAHKIPLVPRGGGTANYGQSVPSQGGIILEMTNLSGVVKIGVGVLRALGGTMMNEVDAAARKEGWELRIHPSTRSTATIAGFVAGGSGGMGSCAYGMLRDRGNVTGLLVMSVEAEPRLIELRGRDVDLVHHAYGANGIIIEVEMPLAPAWKWRECIVAFPDFMSAARFGVRLAHEAGVTKKLISLQEWPTAELMADLKPFVPEGATMAMLKGKDPIPPRFTNTLTATACAMYNAPTRATPRCRACSRRTTFSPRSRPYIKVMKARCRCDARSLSRTATSSPWAHITSRLRMRNKWRDLLSSCKARASLSRTTTRVACARSASR